MQVTVIAAVADNGVIGRRGELPWHLPADLARFKATTMGHHLIVGRRTFDAMGRALPGRRILVVSRGHPPLPAGVRLAASLDAALAAAAAAGETEAFIGGGEEIYRQALGRADRLLLTRVRATVEGDARFPPLDPREWRLVAQEDRAADERNAIAVRFEAYVRKGPRPVDGAGGADEVDRGGA